MIAHAAAESYGQWAIKEEFYPYAVAPTITTVVLGVDGGHTAIKRLSRKLQKKSIKHVVFCEPDSPWNGAAMSIGLLPGERKELSGVVKRLELYGKEEFDKDCSVKQANYRATCSCTTCCEK